MSSASPNKLSLRKKALEHLARKGWVSLNMLVPIIDSSYPTVLRMKENNQINFVQIGGIFRVYREEVQRLAGPNVNLNVPYHPKIKD